MQDTTILRSPFQTLLVVWEVVPVLCFSGTCSHPPHGQVGDVGRGQYPQGMSFGPVWKGDGEASMLLLPVHAALPPLQVSPATPILTVVFADTAKSNLGF